MKNLKNMMAAVTMLAVLVLGTTSANAGLLMSDRANPGQGNSCTVKQDIMADLTGIILHRMGIILSKGGTNTEVSCGIILGD